MSFKTPPPCSSPRQNHGACGPLCSSAARARYGRPALARPAIPQQRATRFDLRREQLILEIAVRDADTLDELHHALGFRHVAGEGLLAGNALQRAFATFHGVHDLLDVLEPGVIGAGEP